MKRFILLIACVFAMAAAASAATPRQTITVETAEEFLDALGSDRVIVVTESFNLTEAVKARQSKLYKRPGGNPQIYALDNFDGPELVICNMKNLAIVSGADVITLYVEPRYVNVLSFENCEGIELRGLTLGHVEEGYCDRGVLGFENCKNVSITECDLYGCGTEGIVVTSCTDFKMSGSKIRDCSYHIMHVYDCINVTFEGCQFFRNREFSLVNINVSENVLFNNCMFANNEGLLFSLSCPVRLRNSVVLHFDDHIIDYESSDSDFLIWENSIQEDFFHPEMTIEAVYG